MLYNLSSFGVRSLTTRFSGHFTGYWRCIMKRLLAVLLGIALGAWAIKLTVATSPAEKPPANTPPAELKKPTFREIYEQANYSATLAILYEEEIEVTITEWKEEKQPNGTIIRKPIEVKKKEKQFHPFIMSGFVVKDEKNGKFYIYTAGHIYNSKYKLLAIRANFKKNLPKEEMELIGYDLKADLAILGFKKENFIFNGRTAKLGDSSLIEPTDPIMAIGHPRVLFDHAPTTGTVVKENIPYLNRIAHTARINYGSSGGPLLNERGEVIGINVLIMNDDLGVYLFGLATPVNYLKKLDAKLKAGGEIKHADLQTLLMDSNEGVLAYYVYDVSILIVEEEKLYLRNGDIILSYDGRTPKNALEIEEYIFFEKKPGDKIKFKVKRENKELEFEKELKEFKLK